MDWKLVKTASNSKGGSSPYASVGFGRISLNVAASSLIEDYQKYSYVEFLKAYFNGKLYIGMRFLLENEKTEYSYPIKYKTANGKKTGGVEITGKKIMAELFGPNAAENKVTRYNVKPDDTDHRILMIF